MYRVSRGILPVSSGLCLWDFAGTEVQTLHLSDNNMGVVRCRVCWQYVCCFLNGFCFIVWGVFASGNARFKGFSICPYNIDAAAISSHYIFSWTISVDSSPCVTWLGSLEQLCGTDMHCAFLCQLLWIYPINLASYCLKVFMSPWSACYDCFHTMVWS